jgi:putative peptide zinc metalloprotease protein
MTVVPRAGAEPEAPHWPRLRTGLKFELTSGGDDAFPVLIITDPVRGKYFKASWPESGLFLLWNEAANAAELSQRMLEIYKVSVSEADLKIAADFAFRNELTETDDKGGWQRYGQAAAASRHSLGKTLIHNYLFFRIPLVHPDARLQRLLPYFRFAFTKPFWLFVATVAAVGLYLTTRQWDAVVAAFYDSLQFQSLFLYAAALLALKAIHELGHALATVYYGCRVPSMGIAFMLGAPVLYTDTSDSWRLPDHRQRLAIVFAGVAAEAIVAALALLIWPLLPDGLLKQVCFGFATAALLMSLMVNLNPFMRFDGYFALSDYLKVPNLQSRSFALGTWRLREALFGLGEATPEVFAPARQRLLIAYAYGVWIYRFFLFLGIAYIVYVMAGKALGIVLGLIEIMVFILMPIWGELREWWKRRAQIRLQPRAFVTAGACTAALAAFCLPLIKTVESPGVLLAGQEQQLHVPVSAMLTAVRAQEGQRVQAGDVLFEASAPDLEHKYRKARLETRLLELRLARLIANPDDTEQAVIIKREYRAAREKMQGLKREMAALSIKAPFAGVVTDFDTALAPGAWVAPEHLLARVMADSHARVNALLSDEDLTRVTNGAQGVFIADEADFAAHPVVLEAIVPASDGTFAEPVLADAHGGPVGSAMQDDKLRARHGWVQAAFSVPGAPAPARIVRGIVRVESEAQSALQIVWRQIGRVLVREQGF